MIRRPRSRDVVRSRLLELTGEGRLNPVQRAAEPAPETLPEPAPVAAAQVTAFQHATLHHGVAPQLPAQPSALRRPADQPAPIQVTHPQPALSQTTATGTRLSTTSTRLHLPGELPERLREVDLKLAADRARAVDAEELAAYLEADGLGDEILKDRYGADGLFDAAEMLYRQQGTGKLLNRLSVHRAPAFPWRMLLRGPLYLLPGLVGLLIANAMGRAAESAFILAAAFGWGWSMTVAGVRYAEPFAVPGRGLRLTLLLSGVAGVVGGALIASGLGGWPGQPGALLLGAPLTGALVGGAVALASGAAGVLLALGQFGQFAGAFASPLLAAGIVMALPSREAALFALALMATVPTVTALHATRTPGSLDASWETLRPHLPHALYGWAMAAAFVALSMRLGTWALLPVILGSGLLEAGVWHVQERLQVAARTQRDLLGLRRVGVPTVLFSAAGFGLVLGAGVLVLSWLPLPIPVSLALLTVPLYSAALLLSSWLANQRRTALLTLVWGVGAGVLVLGLSPPLVALTLLLILLFPALDTLTDPRSYRQ